MADQKKTTIYLIRHAQTIGNAEGILQGQTMGGQLSKHGMHQAEALGTWAKTKRIDAVYSSPLSRALQTAAIAFPSKKPIMMDELMEQDVGILSGKTVHDAFEFLHKMGVSRAQASERSIDYYLLRYGNDFGGESEKDVSSRGMAALQKIAKDNPGKTVAVVSHGNFNKCVICTIQGLEFSYDQLTSMHQENTGINTITFAGGSQTVGAINDTSHLDLVIK